MKEYPLSYLPNDKGFEFIAVYKDGTEKLQVVKKNDNGTHYIDDYNQIKGWRRFWDK